MSICLYVRIYNQMISSGVVQPAKPGQEEPVEPQGSEARRQPMPEEERPVRKHSFFSLVKRSFEVYNSVFRTKKSHSKGSVTAKGCAQLRPELAIWLGSMRAQAQLQLAMIFWHSTCKLADK